MRRILITGAARGIGRAIASRLARDALARDGLEAGLLLADLHGDELEAFAGELRAAGADVITAAVDLSDPQVPAQLVEMAATGFGGLDIIVSNAGFAVPAPLLACRTDDWDRIFAVNLRAALLLGQAAHPWLKASMGSFVITTSISGSHPTVPLGAYSASKAAALMLMRQMALEWGPDGIRVNAISPGLTQTPGTAAVYSDPEAKAQRERRIPMRRVAQADDMANAVSFLVGPDAAYVHGVDLVVDGGLGHALMESVSMDGWRSSANAG